jgi:hypothetical protein
MVNISVVIALFNDDGFVTVLMITVTDDVTVAVPVTISLTLTNRYASTANTNPTSSAPAGIALKIPTTAAITTAYFIIACSYRC